MENTGITAIASAFYVFAYLFDLALVAFMLFVQWRVFAKAGEPGWSALIPFYNSYIHFKIAGKKKLFLPYLLIAIGIIVVAIIGSVALVAMLVIARNRDTGYGALGIGALLWILIIGAAVASKVIEIIVNINLAHSFNQSSAFGVGLSLLPMVFWAILAFGNYTYIGNGENTPADPPIEPYNP